MFSLVGMPSGWEWLIVLAIVVLVFGAAKLPELARGTGQALRIFKAETKGLRDDEDKAEPAKPAAELSPADERLPTDVAEGEIVDERRERNA